MNLELGDPNDINCDLYWIPVARRLYWIPVAKKLY